MFEIPIDPTNLLIRVVIDINGQIHIEFPLIITCIEEVYAGTSCQISSGIFNLPLLKYILELLKN